MAAEESGNVEFLSPEWIAALDDALAQITPPDGLERFALDQIVDGVPGRGEVVYRIAVADGHFRATSRSAGDLPADVRLRTDYGTASAIARGAANAQQALAAGRLQIGGNFDRLAHAADALTLLGDGTATLRARTSFVDAA